jgi:CBS domain-containing protein
MNLADNLNSDTIAQVRPSAALSVQPECTIAEAVQLMKQKKVGCLLVCERKRLAGIFTERDLLVRVFAAGRPLADSIADVMTRDPEVITMQDTIRRALSRMEQGGHRHLPVVDETGKPAGILSVKRLVHYLAEHFPATVYNLPPGRGDYPLHRGGA